MFPAFPLEKPLRGFNDGEGNTPAARRIRHLYMRTLVHTRARIHTSIQIPIRSHPTSGYFLQPVPRPSPFITHLTCPPAAPQGSTLLAGVSSLPFNFTLRVCEQSEPPQTPCTQCPSPRSPPSDPLISRSELLQEGRGVRGGCCGVALPPSPPLPSAARRGLGPGEQESLAPAAI